MPKKTTAIVSHHRLERLITLAAKHADTTQPAAPVLGQVRLRRFGNLLEATATNRYSAAFITGPISKEESWPRNLDLSLTVRQWRTILATFKPSRSTRKLANPRTFTIRTDGTVTVSRPQTSNEDDTVNALTFQLPAGAWPNIDNLRTINPRKITNLPPTTVDSNLLALLPPGPCRIYTETPPPCHPIHFIADDWHVAVMPMRSEFHLPARWTE